MTDHRPPVTTFFTGKRFIAIRLTDFHQRIPLINQMLEKVSATEKVLTYWTPDMGHRVQKVSYPVSGRTDK